MKTIYVYKATNTQLDWLVARIEGLPLELDPMGFRRVAPDSPQAGWWVWPGSPQAGQALMVGHDYSPSTNPAQMHQIAEREKIDRVWQAGGRGDVWTAYLGEHDEYAQDGETSLIAAARCYVASQLGEAVEIPEDLA